MPRRNKENRNGMNTVELVRMGYEHTMGYTMEYTGARKIVTDPSTMFVSVRMRIHQLLHSNSMSPACLEVPPCTSKLLINSSASTHNRIVYRMA